MNKISFERLDTDGIVSTGRLMISYIAIDTPNYFPVLRASQRPNELDLLIGQKGKYTLNHVDGAVVRLYSIPSLVEPKIDQLRKEENNEQTTLDGGIRRSPFATYYNSNLLICDPCMEFTLINKPKYDKKFFNLDAVPILRDYFLQYEKNTKNLVNQDKGSLTRLRTRMHDDLWLGTSRSARKDRYNMLTDLMKYQLQTFPIGIPTSHMTRTLEDMKNNIEINDICQALSYQAGKECANYILFHKSTIKNDDIMGKYIDFLTRNKEANLNIVKFKDLDLHCPVDYRARRAFRNFLADIGSLKERQPNRAFMIFDTGTQYYVSMQSFDIVSTTLTGFDGEIDGGKRTSGKVYHPYWWDELKMWPRPTDDAPHPDPNHCQTCAETPNFELDEDIINRKRRIHRLNDLNQNAKEIYEAVSAKDVGIVMRKRLGHAEFSYAMDLILSP